MASFGGQILVNAQGKFKPLVCVHIPGRYRTLDTAAAKSERYFVCNRGRHASVVATNGAGPCQPDRSYMSYARHAYSLPEAARRRHSAALIAENVVVLTIYPRPSLD